MDKQMKYHLLTAEYLRFISLLSWAALEQPQHFDKYIKRWQAAQPWFEKQWKELEADDSFEFIPLADTDLKEVREHIYAFIRLAGEFKGYEQADKSKEIYRRYRMRKEPEE